MIPRQPEHPAIPGTLPPPATPLGWLGRQLDRLRWELLPLGAATVYGTALEAYAATGPGWEQSTAFGVTAAVLGGITVPVRGLSEAGSWACGAGAAACAWSSWQLLDPSFGGVLVGSVATLVGSVPYWRFIAKRRDADRETRAAVQIEALRAHRGTSLIPAQREAPALEAAPSSDREPLAAVTWPGVRDGLSITQPIALSPYTDITLPGGHVLIGGATNAGKSGVVHVICANVITRPDAMLLGVDMKPGAVELGMYRRAGARIASTKNEARELLEWVIAEGRHRGEQMGESFADTGTIVRKWTATPEHPHLVVVIDELAELVDALPTVAADMRSISRLLRAMGVTLVGCTQSPSAGVWGGSTDARGQFDTRICLRTAEADQTNIVLGRGAHGQGWRATDLAGEGEFLIQSPRHTVPDPDRAYWLSDKTLAAHIQQYATGEPPAGRDETPEPAPDSGGFVSSGSTTEDILIYLRDHRAAPVDVAEAIGRNKDSVRAIISKLARDGKLKKHADGSYSATRQGETLVGNVVRFRSRNQA